MASFANLPCPLLKTLVRLPPLNKLFRVITLEAIRTGTLIPKVAFPTLLEFVAIFSRTSSGVKVIPPYFSYCESSNSAEAILASNAASAFAACNCRA